MTRKQSLYFTYDGRDSRDLGIVQIQKGNGLFEESFMPVRTIVEEMIPGRDEPYYYGTSLTPIEDDIVLYTDNELTTRQVEEICDFLFAPYYKPLTFSDNPERIYFAMFIGDAKLIHNGAEQGYFSIKFRCNSPYSFSPVYNRAAYISSESSYTELEVINSGIGEVFPVIEVQKIGNGEINIINTSDGGSETVIKGLIDKQYVEIDTETNNLSSNIKHPSIYEGFNLVYPRLIRGINRFKIKGKSNIIISYYYKYYS